MSKLFVSKYVKQIPSPRQGLIYICKPGRRPTNILGPREAFSCWLFFTHFSQAWANLGGTVEFRILQVSGGTRCHAKTPHARRLRHTHGAFSCHSWCKSSYFFLPLGWRWTVCHGKPGHGTLPGVVCKRYYRIESIGCNQRSPHICM